MNPVKYTLSAGIFFLVIGIIFPLQAIITRHDVVDEKYVRLAEKHPEFRALAFINKTDMAGTLIKPGWIISAAHVAADLSPGDSVIVNDAKHRITRVVIHPGWEDDRSYDIALLRIQDPVSDIIPVEPLRDRNELHKKVLIAGNGDKGTGLSGPAGNDGKLRAATNLVDTVSDRWLKWNFTSPDEDSVSVTEFEGISGPGDSGGPAFIRYGNKLYLAGISSGQSTRYTGGREGIYGVTEYYVRVSSHIKWIKSEIAKY
jgi:hypothetical protein